MKKTSVVYINVNAIFVKTLILICMILLIFAYWKWNRIEKIQIGSDELKAEVSLDTQQEIKPILVGLKNSNPAMKPTPIEGLYRLRLISRRATKTYTFDNLGLIYDCEQKAYYKPSKSLQSYLQSAQRRLTQLSPYGKLEAWQKINQRFNLNKKILIRDLDTGKKFSVERIGGLRHADVEPLTKQDSENIKQIYEGRWSWKRRAVIAYIDGEKIAASMNGMPHDDDNNKTNGIKGHFCLYFCESNHPQDKLNLAHEMMVWKAAGKIKDKFREVSPEHTIQLVFTAIDQGDYTTVGMICRDASAAAKLARKNVISCTIKKVAAEKNLQYRVTAKVSYLNGPYEMIKQVPVELRYDPIRRIYFIDTGLIKRI